MPDPEQGPVPALADPFIYNTYLNLLPHRAYEVYMPDREGVLQLRPAGPHDWAKLIVERGWASCLIYRDDRLPVQAVSWRAVYETLEGYPPGTGSYWGMEKHPMLNEGAPSVSFHKMRVVGVGAGWVTRAGESRISDKDGLEEFATMVAKGALAKVPVSRRMQRRMHVPRRAWGG